MPKDRSSRFASSESRRSRASPYFSSDGRSSSSRRSEESSAATAAANISSHGRSKSSRRSEESSAAAAVIAAKEAAEWEEVRCPVCMDHPHNAVLLICSSHDKGCRPFLCDTSSRHSNCLDQYRKASKDSSKDSGAAAATPECSECQQQGNLSCPLCRGPVSHWIKDYDARRHMNCKVRSCTMESCEFKGAYSELREHARTEHPAARPMEVDPVRQRDWRRMEQQRDIGDLLSMLRSGFSSSLDDAAIGASGEGEEEITERTLHSHGHGHSITMIFIMRSTSSIQQYLSSRSRLFVVSRSVDESLPARASSGGGDADATGPDSEEGDDPLASTEASQHDAEEDAEEADGDPAQ
ncbi:hypothetical protein EJB05_17862, partial [Eragrostis curvula]